MPEATAQIEDHDTVRSLLASLDELVRFSPASPWSIGWIFRGQSDSEWSLQPTAWRSPGAGPLGRLQRIKNSLHRSHLDGVWHKVQSTPGLGDETADRVIEAMAQARAELSVLLEFVSLADSVGHPVPDADQISNFISMTIEETTRAIPLVRFFPRLNSAAALARHHGLPTRALDFSRNPLVAAYFAAASLSPSDLGGRIAIWAIDAGDSEVNVAHEDCDDTIAAFKLICTPLAGNAFLRAQSGVFVEFCSPCAHHVKHGRRPNLIDSQLLRTARRMSHPRIVKLTLPRALCGDLLAALWRSGVSAAHLMPTFDHVVAALDSRWAREDYGATFANAIQPRLAVGPQ